MRGSTDPEERYVTGERVHLECDFHPTLTHPSFPAPGRARSSPFLTDSLDVVERVVRMPSTVRDWRVTHSKIRATACRAQGGVTLARVPQVPVKLDVSTCGTPMSFDGVSHHTESKRSTPRPLVCEYGFARVGWRSARTTSRARGDRRTWSPIARLASAGTGLPRPLRQPRFTGMAYSRTEPTGLLVGSGSPAAAIGPDTFSARWSACRRSSRHLHVLHPKATACGCGDVPLGPFLTWLPKTAARSPCRGTAIRHCMEFYYARAPRRRDCCGAARRPEGRGPVHASV